MIRYLVTAAHSYTVGIYLNSWGRELADRVRIVPYRLAGRRSTPPAGTWIFSDVDRLGSDLRRRATGLRRRIDARGAGSRALNHPRESMDRLELLTDLHEAGVNDFRAVRADRAADRPSELAYPVFVRDAVLHAGARTGLIRSPEALEAELAELARSGDLRERLVVEFCDTAGEDGLYRKYAAFRVGEAIVPRHLVVSRDWMIKYPDLLGEEQLAEERAYLRENPHADRLRSISERAGIEYGRIDYGLRDGRVQVWEINTNPMVMLPPHRYEPRHRSHQTWFHERIAAAFRRLDAGGGGGEEDPPGHRLATWGARAWSGLHRLYGRTLAR